MMDMLKNIVKNILKNVAVILSRESRGHFVANNVGL